MRLAAAILAAGALASSQAVVLPKFTHSGYLPVRPNGESLFYVYHEQSAPHQANVESPIILWLQGGPGCTSVGYGDLWELGPQRLQKDGLTLEANEFGWNRNNGLLMLDQPLGTGYSDQPAVPVNTEDQVAADVYVALQGFFSRHQHFRKRPFFIAGESFAGKYIPSVASYILKQKQAGQQREAAAAAAAAATVATNRRLLLGAGADVSAAAGSAKTLFASAANWLSGLFSPSSAASQQQPQQGVDHPAPVTPSVQQLADDPPYFELRGVLIGNGYTDPKNQTLWVAPTAFAFGLIDKGEMDVVNEMAEDMEAGRMVAAVRHREEVLDMIQNLTQLATMFDIRREDGYDDRDRVDEYLAIPEVMNAYGAHLAPGRKYQACNEAITSSFDEESALSVTDKVQDVLEQIPVLLYQGNYDLQDGPTGNLAWLTELPWTGNAAFRAAKRWVWKVDGKRAGYVKQARTLRHIVVLNAGHMVPRDQGKNSLLMAENFIHDVLAGNIGTKSA